MNNINEIIIKRVRGRERDYIASYYNDFLKANFSVYFTDTVFGAVALSNFYEMIKKSFKEDNIKLEITDDLNDKRFLEILEREVM